MKWEILKGSEKDFDGAPDIAVYVLNFGGLIYADSSMVSVESSPYEIDEDKLRRYLVAERRPITEPVVNQQLTTEWSGEGLPPVGVECEMLWNKEWVKCVIKAYGDEQFIFKADGHREWAGHISNFSFRPIRSHEDVARARVRSKECDKIFSILSGVERQGNRSDMAEAIYDAGYRKVE